MITQVILPKLGQTMEEGAIVEWLKQEGEPVQRGDVLFTVETDKAVLEVEATARGYLRQILVPAGETVPVLTPVALITRNADESLEGWQEGAASEPQPEALASAEAPARDAVPPASRPSGERIFASPRARKTARERDVDLALVVGSGPNGRIVEADVLAYAEKVTAEAAVAKETEPRVTPVARRTAQALGVDLTGMRGSGTGGRVTKADVEAAAAPAPAPTAPPAAERVPLTGVRAIIAERMAASDAATARVTLVTEADATDLVAVRQQLKAAVSEEWGFAPGYNDLLGLIVARTLGEMPYMNARLSEDATAIDQLPYVNLGVAVDTERGLLVPVIRDADRKGLRAFGTEFRALAERARAGRSLPDDLTGGTFTITNLGMYEIEAFTPIINLPEAAILGAGQIVPKAVVRGGEIVARQIWTLSLVFDHRLVDGAPAARFLQRIKRLVENPYLLLE
ncbi:MAG: 2-oxo acid dehydrogenase subunit E2 [Anaerolineae bacterium]|jgi:pyruvate dehydrogenase E2 component (dihydrolipoamide acetyltransferase)